MICKRIVGLYQNGWYPMMVIWTDETDNKGNWLKMFESLVHFDHDAIASEIW